jgi:serine/threonine protein phosphatase PrpC
VRNIKDPQEASKKLVEHALSAFSSDNLSCMIVRLDPTGKFEGIPDSGADVAAAASAGAKKEDSKPTAAPPPTKASTENVAEKVAKG